MALIEAIRNWLEYPTLPTAPLSSENEWGYCIYDRGNPGDSDPAAMSKLIISLIFRAVKSKALLFSFLFPVILLKLFEP